MTQKRGPWLSVRQTVWEGLLGPFRLWRGVIAVGWPPILAYVVWGVVLAGLPRETSMTLRSATDVLPVPIAFLCAYGAVLQLRLGRVPAIGDMATIFAFRFLAVSVPVYLFLFHLLPDAALRAAGLYLALPYLVAAGGASGLGQVLAFVALGIPLAVAVVVHLFALLSLLLGATRMDALARVGASMRVGFRSMAILIGIVVPYVVLQFWVVFENRWAWWSPLVHDVVPMLMFVALTVAMASIDRRWGSRPDPEGTGLAARDALMAPSDAVPNGVRG